MHIHLTFDIDWAPDWIMEEILMLLDKKKIKATFFCTHKSNINNEIERQGHNLGIHPNFLPGSSQGKNNFEIINNLINLFPKSTCIRTHSLVQSSPLFNEIFSIKSQLLYDFSLFTPGLGLTKKIIWQNHKIKFWRLNYQWEDDCCFHLQNYNWDKIHLEESNNVLNFHPVHIYLNSKDGSNYKSLKNILNGRKLQNANKSDFLGIVNNKKGAKDALLQTINSGKCINFEDLLSELQ